MVDHLGLPPDRLLFVDDRQVRTDPGGGRSPGMHNCHTEWNAHEGLTLPPEQGCFATILPSVILPATSTTPQANVDGALAAGIPAVRFESAEQLEEELRQRGFHL